MTEERYREIRSGSSGQQLKFVLRDSAFYGGAAAVSRLLSLLNPNVRQVLGVVHRDEPARLFRKLLFRRPHLILLGLRGLLTSGSFFDSK